jgi:hypothetical protein
MKKLLVILVLLLSVNCFSQEKEIITDTPYKVSFFFTSSKIIMKYSDMTPEMIYTISYKKRMSDVDIFLVEGSDTAILRGVLNDKKTGFIQIQTGNKLLTFFYKLN